MSKTKKPSGAPETSCRQVREVGFMDLQALKRSGKPVLVQFAAKWCGACKATNPEIQKAACALGESAEVVRVDVDENPMLAAQHKVEAYPTVVVYQGGKIVKREEGAGKAADFVELVKGAGK